MTGQMSFVLSLPLAQMSAYADPVCRNNIDSDWLTDSVLLTEINRDDVFKMNKTSFGNLAYVALYHSDKEVREHAAKLIAQVKTFI